MPLVGDVGLTWEAFFYIAILRVCVVLRSGFVGNHVKIVRF